MLDTSQKQKFYISWNDLQVHSSHYGEFLQDGYLGHQDENWETTALSTKLHQHVGQRM